MMHNSKMNKAVFAESCIPPLASGEYKITLTQKSGTLGDSDTAEQTFFVEGPRFSLQADDICAVYPPNQMKGGFGSSLPHVAFQRKTLPWERAAEKQLSESNHAAPSFKVPWIALLQLWENEIINIQTATVKETVIPTSNNVYFPKLYIRKDEEETLCNYIDIETTLFRQVFPAYSDLAFLCHARQTDPYLKVDGVNATGSEWHSLLIGARLPDVSPGGKKNKVYVVSLEGFDNYTANSAIDSYAYVRLIVLYSWSYDAVDKDYHFKDICDGLSIASFTLPSDQSGEKLKPLLENGFVPIIHHIRNGDNTVSFYRGPLTPALIKKADYVVSVPSADSLYIYDPEIGMFDVSYAYAWQIGRLLALNNKTVAVKIMRSRNQNRQIVHRASLKLRMKEHFNFMEENTLLSAHDDPMGKHVLELLNQQLLRGLL